MLNKLLGRIWPFRKPPRAQAVVGPIPQEKAVEYMQVAALVCMDLELLQDIAYRSDMTLEDLRQHIDIFVENKDAAINDAAARQGRYAAAAMLLGLKRA